ncbi:MAG: hypothetical protein JW855_02755 [Gammaproteobacteria bacterium]|nr:hypothetical protein [Gammaproteobacteria bacterium]
MYETDDSRKIVIIQKRAENCPIAIDQSKNIYIDVSRKAQIIEDILQTRLEGWVITPEIWTLKNNCKVSLRIEERVGDWKNLPLLKGKINEAFHDPNVWAELMTLFYNNNPISNSVWGLWLDGGRLMLPYPKNRETSSGFEYFIDDALAWHLALLRTTQVFGEMDRINYWLKKLDIQKKV